MVLLIIFFAIMIVVICRRRRLRQGRTGYVVVRGQNYMPGTVVTQNNAQIAQVWEQEKSRQSHALLPLFWSLKPWRNYTIKVSVITVGILHRELYNTCFQKVCHFGYRTCFRVSDISHVSMMKTRLYSQSGVLSGIVYWRWPPPRVRRRIAGPALKIFSDSSDTDHDSLLECLILFCRWHPLEQFTHHIMVLLLPTKDTRIHILVEKVHMAAPLPMPHLHKRINEPK